jgi:hypothetical protein
VQAELADIGEQAETLKAQAEAPAADAEKSAGEAFGVGTTSDTDLKTTTAPVAADQGTTTPSASEGAAPVGERPRSIAGEGTTTASDEPVNPLSATSDGVTSTGQPEPLPQDLSAGEPGTGGPAGSAQAPSTPDSTETPTTGMEQPPVIDRAAEVAERGSGAFVGNKSTRVFHAADSGHLPAKNKRVYFESAEEAIAAGFRPAEGEGLERNANVSRP